MKYIITAGGTGGHIYPALTIAKALKGDEVLFIASKKDLDKSILSKVDFKITIKYWHLSGFLRKLTPKNIILNIINVFKLLICIVRSIVLIIKFKPDAVIGFGGYISFPIVFIASIFNIKTIIHEQNSYPGVVNRQLGKRVDKVCITYKASEVYFDKKKVVYTSNPRIDVVNENNDQSHIKYDVMSIGGSLGAEVINENILEYAKNNSNKQVKLITGERYYKEYEDIDLKNLKIKEYSEDIFTDIRQSDVIITRGGATTLLELVAMEKLIIVIPSINVVADHQTTNAEAFESKNMLKIIPEKELDESRLSTEINDIIKHRDVYISNIRNNKDRKATQKMIKVIKDGRN